MRKNGSRKVIISLSVLSAVLVAVVISMAAVLASFTAVSNNSFDVSYTAGSNVKAEISTEYQVLNYTSAHSGSNFIDVSAKLGSTWKTAIAKQTFTGTETAETTTKSGTASIDGAFTGSATSKYDILVIRFTIKNNGNSAITLTGSATPGAENANMVVTHASAAAGTATTALSGTATTINAGASVTVFVQVRVNVYTVAARFQSNYQFTLQA